MEVQVGGVGLKLCVAGGYGSAFLVLGNEPEGRQPFFLKVQHPLRQERKTLLYLWQTFLLGLIV